MNFQQYLVEATRLFEFTEKDRYKDYNPERDDEPVSTNSDDIKAGKRFKKLLDADYDLFENLVGADKTAITKMMAGNKLKKDYETDTKIDYKAVLDPNTNYIVTFVLKDGIVKKINPRYLGKRAGYSLGDFDFGPEYMKTWFVNKPSLPTMKRIKL